MNQNTGVLLINLGSPLSPSRKHVSRYLREFFSDPRVFDVNPLLRLFFFQNTLAPIRAINSSKLYQKIWTEKGSPLISLSLDLTSALQKELKDPFVVDCGMRYGQPSISKAINNLMSKSLDQLIILPLYPQYASASTGSALESVLNEIKQYKYLPKLKVINHFFDSPFYINSMAKLIDQYLSSKTFEKIIFSFHGLPLRQISDNPDHCPCDLTKSCPSLNQYNKFCYRNQCHKTTEKIASSLNLEKNAYLTVFQSRVGWNRWIPPYSEDTLVALSKEGIKDIAICCPSFVSDCLETLEEVNIRMRELWKDLGGRNFHFIPCLNNEDFWIKSLATFITQI